MNFKELSAAELQERMKEIRSAVDMEDADLNALEEEARAIKAELETRAAAEAEKAEVREDVAAGRNTEEIEKPEEERKTMTFAEFRKSDEYINAYADYIKSGRENEIRMLISANAPEGTEGDIVPVPTYLEEKIQTAWEKDGILSRVRKTFVKGNLESCFELSATPAVVHAEGDEEPAEEELVLGTIKLVPEMIKKWITLTDTVAKLKGREFIDYLYDEITYRIILKAQEVGITDIVNAPAASSAQAIGVPVVNGAPSVTIVPTAAANLSAEATDIVVIMNRLTEVEFLNAQVAGSFAVDPFAGLPRVYTSALKAYSAASADETYAIVGDLKGLQFNFPDGDDVEIIYDPYTMAEKNRIKLVGRYFAAHGVTGLGRFAKITK